MGTEVVIETSAGRVLGRVNDDVSAFLGVRYAAAPVSDLRFRPPVPISQFDGVIDARRFGPSAPQAPWGLGSYIPGDPIEQDEDCLFLNIWTPGLDQKRRPVMVFLHGGAFVAGSGSSVIYRGDRLAARDVVVVTCNYRLGALGFLAHRALFDEQSGGFGNWGLFDQLCALEWVHEHIEDFGGDPNLVTLFGESAGAMSTADLLATHAPGSLFQRAILQSGASSATWSRPAEQTAERFGSLLELKELTRENLRNVPVEEILDAQKVIVESIDAGVGMPFRPVVDGGLFSVHPTSSIARGSARAVDVLVGTNRDEYKFFTATSAELNELDVATLEAIVARYVQGGGAAARFSVEELMSVYRAARSDRGEDTSPRSLLDAFGTDWIFRIPSLRLLEACARFNPRAYSYLFTWQSPFARGALGSCHALELPFVFGTLSHPVVALFAGNGADAEALSENMQSAWVAFAKSGDPTCEQVSNWPAYAPPRRATMVLGSSTQLREGLYEQERAFYEERLGSYGDDRATESERSSSVALLGEGNLAEGT